jgi:hypothetical protein
MHKLALAASSLIALTFATNANAGVSYGGCLKAADPSVCMVGKAFDGTGAMPWQDRLVLLVQSGDVGRTVKFASRVRPLDGVLGNLHALPSDNDIAAVESVDPDGAALLRANAGNDLDWSRELGAHGAELATRLLPPSSIAGYALAAAAYRSADPFNDPEVKAALAKVPPGSPKDDAQVLLRAMRSIGPDGRAYSVAPPGARAVLERAKQLAEPSAAFTATLANFAWWAGDDAAASAALEHLKSDRAAAARNWASSARIWAALGRPAEAQALVDAHGEGRDKVLAELAIGDAWVRKGDKARAIASAHAALGDGGDDPVAWVAAPQLLNRAGAHEEALSSAQSLAARAEASDRALRSAALAAASESLAAIGENEDACRLARRSLALVNDSAAAQVAAWKAKYQGTQVPLNPWLGVDHSGDPIPVDDVRDAFRERAAAALDACGASAEAAKARSDAGARAWRAVVPVRDETLSPAERLKTAAALVQHDPALAGRLADAAAQAPEPEDPVARVLWRDAEAYALAAAGRSDPARAMSASAVRGLDELTNPEDQESTALVLARDHLALDALTGGQGAFGRRLPD